MQDILEYKTIIVIAAFLLLLALEHLRPAVAPGAHPLRRIIKNLAFWPVNITLSLFIVLPFSFFAAQYALWLRPDWLAGLPALLLDIILLDLFIFWWHRAVHEIPLLWRFHEVHHLDEHLDTSSAIRFHFGEIFFSVLARALLIVVFAVPFTSVLIFEILVLVFTLFHHSNIALPVWFECPLSKVIITPSIHWVHHHAVRRDTDSNYGTIFSFWDRLFRTQSPTQRSTTMKIGVESQKDRTFVDLLTKPFCGRDG